MGVQTIEQVIVQVPQQNNLHDCGLHLIMNAEAVIQVRFHMQGDRYIVECEEI
jgi:Ulp1 family protease